LNHHPTKIFKRNSSNPKTKTLKPLEELVKPVVEFVAENE
jgi:hypothetical protein